MAIGLYNSNLKNRPYYIFAYVVDGKTIGVDFAKGNIDEPAMTSIKRQAHRRINATNTQSESVTVEQGLKLVRLAHRAQKKFTFKQLEQIDFMERYVKREEWQTRLAAPKCHSGAADRSQLHVVYALRADEIHFYVGRTIENRMSKRFLEHLRDAETGVKSMKADFIRKAQAAGKRIDMVELSNGTFEMVKNAEAMWISEFRDIYGYELANGNDGADPRDTPAEEVLHREIILNTHRAAKWRRAGKKEKIDKLDPPKQKSYFDQAEYDRLMALRDTNPPQFAKEFDALQRRIDALRAKDRLEAIKQYENAKVNE